MINPVSDLGSPLVLGNSKKNLHHVKHPLYLLPLLIITNNLTCKDITTKTMSEFFFEVMLLVND